MRILGLDPGLQRTGWGVIDHNGNALSFVACGAIRTPSADPLSVRLVHIDDVLTDVLARFSPDEAAIEETFVNCNPASALKLGQARGAAIVALARGGRMVHEYAPNRIKKSLVGGGHAHKDQIGMMVRTLLPGAQIDGPDEADALAIAICHAHHAPPAAMRKGYA